MMGLPTASKTNITLVIALLAVGLIGTVAQLLTRRLVVSPDELTRTLEVMALATALAGSAAALVLLVLAAIGQTREHGTDGGAAGATPDAGALGKRDGAPGASPDVTDLTRARQALIASEEKFRALLEHSTEAVVIVDQTGRIVLVNAQCEALFGYRREELLDRTVEVLVAEDLRKLHGEQREAFARHPQARPMGGGRHLTGRCKDGRIIPIEIGLSYARVGGGIWVMSHIIDLRDRLATERMKNEFVSVVSHELRTPLTSIRGSLGLLAGGVAGPLSAQAHQLVQIALSSCERLVRLVSDVLDIEKIEAGKIAFNMSTLDLASLVRSAIEANRSYGGQLGVTFRLDVEDGDARVTGDADRLTQVVTNLLSNAAKHAPPGGEVAASVTRRDACLRVAVHNSGPDIPEEFRSRIFEKFAQADTADARQRGGSGLGLAISRTIVEKHGGHIGFETATGAGTTFFFELPADSPVASATARPRAGDDEGGEP